MIIQRGILCGERCYLLAETKEQERVRIAVKPDLTVSPSGHITEIQTLLNVGVTFQVAKWGESVLVQSGKQIYHVRIEGDRSYSDCAIYPEDLFKLPEVDHFTDEEKIQLAFLIDYIGDLEQGEEYKHHFLRPLPQPQMTLHKPISLEQVSEKH